MYVFGQMGYPCQNSVSIHPVWVGRISCNKVFNIDPLNQPHVCDTSIKLGIDVTSRFLFFNIFQKHGNIQVMVMRMTFLGSDMIGHMAVRKKLCISLIFQMRNLGGSNPSRVNSPQLRFKTLLIYYRP